MNRSTPVETPLGPAEPGRIARDAAGAGSSTLDARTRDRAGSPTLRGDCGYREAGDDHAAGNASSEAGGEGAGREVRPSSARPRGEQGRRSRRAARGGTSQARQQPGRPGGRAIFRQILLDYPGSAAAVDASFLAADALQKAGRPDDAMAMYVEFDRRFAGSPRVADSKLRRARLLQQTRNQARQNEGYALYGEVVRDFPRTPEARAALQARRQIESDRRQLRAIDPGAQRRSAGAASSPCA